MAENKKFLDKDGLSYFYDKIKGEYVKSSDLATVATSGSYNDLNDKPTIPTNTINNLVDGIAEGSIRSINAYDDKTNGLLGENAQAFGDRTIASGECAYAEGYRTLAASNYQHVQGKFNFKDSSNVFAHIVGNGTSENARSNAYVLDWSGNGYYSGDVYVGTSETSAGDKLARITELPKKVSELTNDSGYTTNTGTVTSVAVKMNGETKGTITSSGIIDLGEIGGTAINNLVDGIAAGSLRSINAYDDETNGLLGNNAVAFGYQTAATGMCSHAEGAQTKASGELSHAEGAGTTASGQYAHAEGTSGTASGQGSHTEGTGCTASGQGSHAEGISTTASNPGTHTEGTSTSASGWNSHAEGNSSDASGSCSHAEGEGSIANGDHSHAGGYHSYAEGRGAFAMGDRVSADGAYSTVIGSRNVNDESGVDDPTKKGDYLFIAGNGSDAELSNACTLDWQGNAWFAGDIYVGSTSGTSKDKGSKKVATTDDILTYTVVSTW